MAGIVDITEVQNPLAQTFRVTHPAGAVVTAFSVYMYSAPTTSDPQISLIGELRPVVNGEPSSSRFFPGTRVTVTAADARAVANTSWNEASLPELKFSFDEPIYIPTQTDVAIVLYTNAAAGQYQVWHAKLADYKWIGGQQSTEAKVVSQPAVGSLFQSSNGTTWTPRQDQDLAFKVYKAEFTQDNATAILDINRPPVKLLSQAAAGPAFKILNNNGDLADPLIFTAGSSLVRVIHPEHGYIVGDKVTLSEDSLASSTMPSTVNGISKTSILGKHTITAADAWGYTIDVGTNATASIRAGGNGIRATEQYRFPIFTMNVPRQVPPSTKINFYGSFVRAGQIQDPTGVLSLPSGTSVYDVDPGVPVYPEVRQTFKHPYVLVDSNQEVSQSVSNTLAVAFNTQDANVAPSINVRNSTFRMITPWVDYVDSDAAPATVGHNYSSTLDYVPETDPIGGVSASKHITIPFNLAGANAATSIKVLMDASRPPNTDFDVYFRTCNRDNQDIRTLPWVEFSKTSEGPNVSNYNDLAASFDFKEYEFSVFDLPSFDTYQIKIVMRSSNISNILAFSNLRTIATL